MSEVKENSYECRASAGGFADEHAKPHGSCVIVFDEDRCTRCGECELKCETNKTSPNVRYREIADGRGRYQRDAEIKLTRAICRRCEAMDCAEACSEGAVVRVAEGILVDCRLCNGCGACGEACCQFAPRSALERLRRECGVCVGEIDSVSELLPCVAACVTGALRLEIRGARPGAPLGI